MRRCSRCGAIPQPDKPRLTVAEHVAHGNSLKAASQALRCVMAHFQKSSHAAQAALQAERGLGKLKSELDRDVQNIVPRERDPRGLAILCYYGTPFIPDAHTQDPNDDFAGWTPAEREVIES